MYCNVTQTMNNNTKKKKKDIVHGIKFNIYVMLTFFFFKE